MLGIEQMIVILFNLIIVSLLTLNGMVINRVNVEKSSSYECGFQAFETPLNRKIEISFFMVAVSFLIFDIETILLVIWVIEPLWTLSIIAFFVVLTGTLVVELNANILEVSANLPYHNDRKKDTEFGILRASMWWTALVGLFSDDDQEDTNENGKPSDTVFARFGPRRDGDDDESDDEQEQEGEDGVPLGLDPNDPHTKKLMRQKRFLAKLQELIEKVKQIKEEVEVNEWWEEVVKIFLLLVLAVGLIWLAAWILSKIFDTLTPEQMKELVERTEAEKKKVLEYDPDAPENETEQQREERYKKREYDMWRPTWDRLEIERQRKVEARWAHEDRVAKALGPEYEEALREQRVKEVEEEMKWRVINQEIIERESREGLTRPLGQPIERGPINLKLYKDGKPIKPAWVKKAEANIAAKKRNK